MCFCHDNLLSQTGERTLLESRLAATRAGRVAHGRALPLRGRGGSNPSAPGRPILMIHSFGDTVIPLLRALPVATAICTAFSVAGCSSNAGAPPLVPPTTAPTPDNASPTGAVPNDQYVIGSGDSLSVFVYHTPDLSEPGVEVRPDGRISVPLIEDI